VGYRTRAESWRPLSASEREAEPAAASTGWGGGGGGPRVQRRFVRGAVCRPRRAGEDGAMLLRGRAAPAAVTPESDGRTRDGGEACPTLNGGVRGTEQGWRVAAQLARAAGGGAAG